MTEHVKWVKQKLDWNTHLKWNGLTKKQPILVIWMPFWIIQFNLCLEYNISSTVYGYANQTVP